MNRTVSPISIPENEIEEDFIRSSGPGGQNVNKVSSAVQLRFDVWRSKSLSGEVKHRLITLAGRRVNADGVLVITARAHREQALNRAEARERLAELLRQAYIRPKTRKKTRPSAASRQRRLTGKKLLGRKKQQRRGGWDE
jgi:ribosome-associated protein